METQEFNRLGSGKMSKTDVLVAVGKRRADRVTQEWADLGDRFIFYALGNSRAEYDARLANHEVLQPDFKFEALFRKALGIDSERTLGVLSEMHGDAEILAQSKALALKEERGEMSSWVRQAAANALRSIASLASFAD